MKPHRPRVQNWLNSHQEQCPGRMPFLTQATSSDATSSHRSSSSSRETSRNITSSITPGLSNISVPPKPLQAVTNRTSTQPSLDNTETASSTSSTSSSTPVALAPNQPAANQNEPRPGAQNDFPQEGSHFTQPGPPQPMVCTFSASLPQLQYLRNNRTLLLILRISRSLHLRWTGFPQSSS